MIKIAIVVAYFGKFPEYFQLFLNSCKFNKDIDWLIFSDNVEDYDYPANVHLYKMAFSDCKELIQEKFDFSIVLETPQKLCDYKCAYGYIFHEYLEKYDWWGHCDLDQIFGDLRAFISDEMLEMYEKLFSLGHLTLYRNTLENNKLFMSALEGKERYREVFSTEKGCGFDEWLPENVNDIYIEQERNALLTNIGADVDAYHTDFRLLFFDVNNRIYYRDTIKNSIFLWEDGKVFRLYKEKNKFIKVEFPYVHLQKRKMKDVRKEKEAVSFYIIPNRFIDRKQNLNKLITQCGIWKYINFQFVKVKYKSLKYRMKSGDWDFTNIF